MKLIRFLANLSIAILLSTSIVVADDEQKAVLITGATSGIGLKTAEHLAAEGYFVYAGARKDADMEALNQLDNVMAVRLDVTRPEQISAAVDTIKAEGRGLWGLVNNAGVNVVAPLIEASEDDFQFLMDVNVFGVFRVTKAFAPMVIESQGRIVNISSISGVLAGGGYGMYAASKHALEAMTDSLDAELNEHGVRVVAVNPGNYASEIGLSRCKRLLADPGKDDWGLWEDRRLQMIDGCKERLQAGVENEGVSPIGVALAIEQALFEEAPRDRYLIVPEQVQAGWTVAKAINELLAYNNGHEYSYTRDELVELIDMLWPFFSGNKSFDNADDEQMLRELMQPWMRRGEGAEE